MISILINSVFTIGYRCNSDEFLSKCLKIRKYSSPFSYMVIDIKTSLDFIRNNFENYTKKEFICSGNNTFKFNKKDWQCNNIHKNSIITNDHVDILEMDKVCIWNHHDLYDENTINAINIRSSRLIKCLNEDPETMLLFYIEKIQDYQENGYYDLSFLYDFECNFLILVPILNFNKDPILFYDDCRVRIIHFNSNREGWATDLESHPEEWKKIQILINSLYNFDIKEHFKTQHYQ